MSTRWVFPALIAASLLLLAYTAYRAATLSVTYDEGWTLAGINHSVADLLTWRHNDVNTHPLNSLLIKVARRLLGAHIFAYRVPNVAAHAVYLAASLLLARRARSAAAMLLGFALLNFNPFLLDFFSLARGYGLALAATLCGLCCLARAMDVPGGAWETAACACLALATLANLAFLHGLAAVFGAVLLLAVARKRPLSLVGPALVTCALLAGIFTPMRRLEEAGQFYFGGSDSFWGDTVGSLTQTMLYADARGPLSTALAVLVGASVAVIGVAALRAFKGNAYRLEETPSLVFFLVLLFAGLTTTVLHHAAGSRFLLERTALLYVPLFALCAQEAAERAGRALRVGLAVVALLLAANTARAGNLRYTLSWRYDADVQEVMRLLQDEHRRTGRPIHLVLSWPFKFPVAYYKKAWDMDWLEQEVYEYGEKKTRYDYWYVLEDDYDFGYRLDRAAFEEARPRVVLRFSLSGSSLLRGEAK